jgi:hypothetical protein
MDEDEIAVSADAMMEGARTLGDVLDSGGMKMGEAAAAIYRAMERVRRAEAADDVIRRSVRDGLICGHGKHVLRDPPCKECVSEINKFRRRGAD